MSLEEPTYVVTQMSCGDPADITVDTFPALARTYTVCVRTGNGLKSTLHLSPAAAEVLVDGLIEAMTLGGDRHEQPPF